MSEKKYSWYVFSSPVGRENITQEKIEIAISDIEAKDFFGPVIIPTRDEIQSKNSKNAVVKKKLSGFLFLRVLGEMSEGINKSEFVPHALFSTLLSKIKNVRLLSKKPLTQEEVEKLVNEKLLISDDLKEKIENETKNTQQRQSNMSITPNTKIRVVKGPFRGFEAKVISSEDKVYNCSILFFGREMSILLYKDEIIVVGR